MKLYETVDLILKHWFITCTIIATWGFWRAIAAHGSNDE